MTLGPAIPTLRVAHVERSVAYYTEVLGFETKWRWSEDGQFDCALADATLVCVGRGEAVLFLAADGGGAGCSLFFEMAWVEDVDDYAAEIDGAERPRDEPWGSREFRVVDPDGHGLRFSCPSNRRRAV